jgi:putative component of toxin-antitoxin plasmid stabilization module
MELRFYQTAARRQPFAEWLAALDDRQARARIRVRLAMLAAGNYGDIESVGEGVMELRIDWGPRTQDKDIKRAKDYFKDYKARSAQQRPRSSR